MSDQQNQIRNLESQMAKLNSENQELKRNYDSKLKDQGNHAIKAKVAEALTIIQRTLVQK